MISDKGLCEIAQTCNKLEYLNISYCRSITDKSLMTIAESCRNLQEFYFSEAYWITDRSISQIINLCPNLRSLDIAFSRGKIKDANMLMQKNLKIEYLDFAGVMAFRNDSFIVAIIRSSPNLKHFDISGNDIGDEQSDSESDSDTSDPDDDNEQNLEELPSPIPIFAGSSLDRTNLISALSNYIREIGGINPNHSAWFTNNFI
ncbi:12416_t:CDS:2 [Entrophospora sp. SA101]|nr:12416_t:CDS:2 [Entrophospora sp. SA101]